MKPFTIGTIGLVHVMATFPYSAQAACSTTTGVQIEFEGLESNGDAVTSYNCQGSSLDLEDKGGTAGGLGTLSDPITFTASSKCFSPCELIYIPYLKKYARFANSLCDVCDLKCPPKMLIVLWLGSNQKYITDAVSQSQIDCMQKLQAHDQSILRRTTQPYPTNGDALYGPNGCTQQTFPEPQTDACQSTQADLPSLDGSYSIGSALGTDLGAGPAIVSPDENLFSTAPNPDSAVPGNIPLTNPLFTALSPDDPTVPDFFSNPDDATAERFTLGATPALPADLFTRRRRRAVT